MRRPAPQPAPPPDTPPVTTLLCNTAAVPADYLRTDSLDTSLAGCTTPPGSFNVYVYTPYTNLPANTKLEICAGDDLTAATMAGWQVWSDPYRDLNGCDAKSPRVTQDPTYLNVIIIKYIPPPPPAQ